VALPKFQTYRGIWHCHTTVCGTAKLPYAVLLNLALLNYRMWHCQIWYFQTTTYVALLIFRTWHCQIWHCPTTVRGTVKFPCVVLLNSALLRATYGSLAVLIRAVPRNEAQQCNVRQFGGAKFGCATYNSLARPSLAMPLPVVWLQASRALKAIIWSLP
jgi:hypothetical protein